MGSGASRVSPHPPPAQFNDDLIAAVAAAELERLGLVVKTPADTPAPSQPAQEEAVEVIETNADAEDQTSDPAAIPAGGAPVGVVKDETTAQSPLSSQSRGASEASGPEGETSPIVDRTVLAHRSARPYMSLFPKDFVPLQLPHFFALS